MDDNDVQKLRDAYRLIKEVRDKVDCKYCQSHMDIILMMIEDATDITKFNVLYGDDKEAIDKIRQLLQDEAIMRFIAIASRVMSLSRKVKYASIR